MKNNQKGFILITVIMSMGFLLALSATLLMKAMQTVKVSEFSNAMSIAFHLAEGGTNDAYLTLKNGNWHVCDKIVTKRQSLDYEFHHECISNKLRRIVSVGYSRNESRFDLTRTIEVFVVKAIPPNFYENAIYGANNLVFKGNSYIVNGDVLTGNTEEILNTDNITGELKQDKNANPLPELDYELLYNIAYSQGNVYDEWALKNTSIPETFWFIEPTEFTEGIPNILYIETDLILGSKIKNIGGFIIVVGNESKNGDVETGVTINGNVTVDGIIYTKGNFHVNGGGNVLNINGGILSNETITINGNINITYNFMFMNTIKKINPTLNIEIAAWREI